jgi:hypothetical protein
MSKGPKLRTVKRYTVNTVRPDEETGKNYLLFHNLKKARIAGRELLKANNFVSLLNFKRVALPL